MNIPYITTEQMREVDRLMVEQYHISLVQMMENAGRNLAALAVDRFLDKNPHGKQVLILAGRGGNGGGGLVCARRLHNWGAHVQMITTHTADEFQGVPAQQLKALQSLAMTITPAEAGFPDRRIDLIIDAIIGYSLSGDPAGNAARMITWANQMAAPILSLDVPSGLEATSGRAHQPAIKAAATMTLALPKLGFLQESAAEFFGELYLADISVPRELYGSMGIYTGEIFSGKDIIRLSA